jgi:SAM-dependent methyltransferase
MARLADTELRMPALALKNVLRKIRSCGTFWIAEQTMAHLEASRTHELGIVLERLPPRGRILEIGAGTGWQAKVLEQRGYDVSAIDLASSEHRPNRVWPVAEYDGRNIPFPEASFDVVFTSNTLEHIPHLDDFQKEIHRVLKPEGFAIHVLPSGSWRFWTNVTHLLKCWTIPKAHGEHAGNALAEIFYFSRRSWARRFRETDWIVVARDANRLFYTGNSIMDSRLSISARSRLSRVLGSSCHVFVLREKAKENGRLQT